MRRASRLRLEPGRIYRTKEFKRWDTNPSRLVRRLVGEGRLEPLAHGFWRAPPRPAAERFLGGSGRNPRNGG